MKENMPGMKQGTGIAGSETNPLVQNDDIDRGPRKTSSLDEPWARNLPRDVRKAMARHSFDRVSEGIDLSSTEGLKLVERSRRSDAEEDYLNALYDVFSTARDRVGPTHKVYLRGIMEGKTTRQHADELEVSQPAVVQGRKRALDALAKALGAEGLEDRRGIRQGIVRGTMFPITEWLPGFTEGKV